MRPVVREPSESKKKMQLRVQVPKQTNRHLAGQGRVQDYETRHTCTAVRKSCWSKVRARPPIATQLFVKTLPQLLETLLKFGVNTIQPEILFVSCLYQWYYHPFHLRIAVQCTSKHTRDNCIHETYFTSAQPLGPSGISGFRRQTIMGPRLCAMLLS